MQSVEQGVCVADVRIETKGRAGAGARNAGREEGEHSMSSEP